MPGQSQKISPKHTKTWVTVGVAWGLRRPQTGSQEEQHAYERKVFLGLVAVIFIFWIIIKVFGLESESDQSEVVRDKPTIKCSEQVHIYAEFLIKRELKDPGSFEWTESVLGMPTQGVNIYPNGVWHITFRARNSFGGMVVETAEGTWDPKATTDETCRESIRLDRIA